MAPPPIVLPLLAALAATLSAADVRTPIGHVRADMSSSTRLAVASTVTEALSFGPPGSPADPKPPTSLTSPPSSDPEGGGLARTSPPRTGLGVRRPKAPAPTPAPAPAPPAYTPEQASADLDLVLAGRGREYIEARARLEANPGLAAPAIVARLGGVPAPTVVEQRRLLSVLGGIARPEDVRLFADALRREVAAAVRTSQEQGTELRAAEPWREVLRAQGPAAAPALTELVGDKQFSEDLRAQLLGDLVAVTATDALPGLVDLVGLGAPTLRAALRLAIARRAQGSADERARLVAIVDAALTAGDPARKAGLVLLRAAIGDPAGDPAFTRTAAALAEDDAAEFAPRVAAIRVLVARRSDPVSQDSLDRLAARHLAPERRGEQRSEILGALALAGLEVRRAAALVDRLELIRVDAPRVAAPAWAVATLPVGWLDQSQQHPWPEVRVAALARVVGPCNPDLFGRLRAALDLAGPRNEPDPAVAREAIAAIARCGGPDALSALSALVGDGAQGVERRFEAGRRLVEDHGPAGADVVAAALGGADDPIVALRLLRALQRVDSPSPAVRDAVCGAARFDEVAALARRTARDLFPDGDHPCPGAP